MAMEMMNNEEINMPKPSFTEEELKAKIEENPLLKELYDDVTSLEEELSQLKTSENPSADAIATKTRSLEDSRNIFARNAAGMFGGPEDDYKKILSMDKFKQAA